MATRLDPLGDDRVRTGGPCRQRFLQGPALVDPGLGGPPLGPAPKGDNEVGLACRLEVGAAGKGQQQVDSQRPVRQSPGRGHLRAHAGRREDADRAEAAGRGDGRGELVSRQPAAHAGLNDWQLHSESLQEAGQHWQYRG
jgi:hypothetical protein